MRDPDVSVALLDWYDANARVLPWRVPPDASRAGVRPDPYRVWLSEIMLQQTTVAAVKSYFHAFTRRWPTVTDLADSDDADVMAAWAGLGYYARARNLLRAARVVRDSFGGQFPAERETLLTLPGVGPYTASAIAAIGFGAPETAVDGNVERVVARLFAVQTPLPAAKPDLARLAARLTPADRPGDFAQAMMDLGATICTPRSPACAICPLRAACQATAQGIAADLPRKTAKPPKPVRLGIAYVGLRDDGAALLERRPDKGLLGGTLGWPGSDWSAAPADPGPPAPGQWREAPGTLRHTFTHFHLDLTVRAARLPLGANPERGSFWGADDVRPNHLPTLMRKARDVAAHLLAAVEPAEKRL